MRKEQGKLNFTGLLMLAIVIYGGFAAVKYISTNLMVSQIENEIVDDFGLKRGADFTEEEAMQAIRDILSRKDIIFNPDDPTAVDVQIDRTKGKIFYYYKFEVETDYLFFKTKKVVEVENEMGSYG
jgi:hypothetical protein